MDKVDWTEIDPQLGKVRDSDLAKKYKITRQAIYLRRVKLDIPAVETPWDSVQDQMGKMTDREIAKKLGVSISAVAARRRAANIPSTRDLTTRVGAEMDNVLMKTSPWTEYGLGEESIFLFRRVLNAEVMFRALGEFDLILLDEDPDLYLTIVTTTKRLPAELEEKVKLLEVEIVEEDEQAKP